MPEPDPTADTAHECLGVSPDAPPEEVKLAAAHAKSQFNPDNYTEAEKRAARDRFYVVHAAEDALLADGEFPPERTAPTATETLTVTAAREQISPGESVTVSVMLDDTPADEGVVRAGGVTAEIGSGRATLTPAPRGTATESTDQATPETATEVTLTATVGGATATTTVTVVPELVVEPAETTVTAGDTLSVRVTNGAEEPVDGRVETPDGRTTLADGEAQVTLTETGEQTLTAVAGDQTGTAQVTVTPSGAIGLEFTQTTVRTGEPLRVAVRRQSDGRLVSHATVESADGRSWTATDGRVRIRPTEPGQLQLTASREVAGTVTTTATRTVEVVPSSVELAVSAPETVDTDEQFDVTVRESTGEPAAAVRVAARRDGDAVTETVTDDRGEATLSVARPGTYTLRASDNRPHTEVVPGTQELTVVADRSTLAVEVVDPPTTTSPRCRVVVRDEWGRRVPDATVSIDDETATTDDRGRAAITVDGTSRTLTVTHPADRWVGTTTTLSGVEI